MSTGAPNGTEPVWIALSLVLALFISTAAGVLGWLSGQGVAAAILTGGVAFGGTVTLALLIRTAMRG
jgi:hypothetical protein